MIVKANTILEDYAKHGRYPNPNAFGELYTEKNMGRYWRLKLDAYRLGGEAITDAARVLADQEWQPFVPRDFSVTRHLPWLILAIKYGEGDSDRWLSERAFEFVKENITDLESIKGLNTDISQIVQYLQLALLYEFIKCVVKPRHSDELLLSFLTHCCSLSTYPGRLLQHWVVHEGKDRTPPAKKTIIDNWIKDKNIRRFMGHLTPRTPFVVGEPELTYWISWGPIFERFDMPIYEFLLFLQAEQSANRWCD